MSGQATGWAIRQATGAAGRKLLLLALANYADEKGVCWPSQTTLARDTEQSVDTVQRQIGILEGLKLLKRERMPKRRGQWQGYRYTLCLQAGCSPRGQRAVLCPDVRPGQAAISAPTRPHNLRLKPSIEPSIEPSYEPSRKRTADERLLAFQQKQEGVEIVQNRIARRIGDEGWLVLSEMNDTQRARLSTLERQGRLDDETLRDAILEIRIARRR